ncbi:MAG TPA: M15 family metallopeptidase [Spirochaetia bacterium]|nr:M15 family metallopeptidase [Spirochaetia bacterium]
MPILTMMRSPRISPLFVAASLLVLLLVPAAAGAALSWITPEFALSAGDLQDMTSSLPPEIARGILARPQDFLHLMTKVLDQPAALFVLVDKRHSLPAEYVPPDLVPLKNYPVRTTWPNLLLRKSIMPAVMDMVHAARKQGVTITFSSTYRSFEYQRGVYEREVKMYGKEGADRESALPGMSQHQLGTAIDFGTISDGYEKTREGAWVAEHAWEYGFTLSYPPGLEDVTGYRYESWHYRYVSRPGALMQREFFGDVQQYFLEFLDANRATLEQLRMKTD